MGLYQSTDTVGLFFHHHSLKATPLVQPHSKLLGFVTADDWADAHAKKRFMLISRLLDIGAETAILQLLAQCPGIIPILEAAYLHGPG